MTSRSLKWAPALALMLLLAACGGGGGSTADASGSGTGTQLRPTVWTSEGRSFNSCMLHPVCSGIPTAPFVAQLSSAPDNGATLSGVVRIEVHGNDMENVELLPAQGYAPKLGVFNITGDKTLAWLDLDTTALPNGPLNVRISAFDVPPGQAGQEIIVMPALTWQIANTSPPSSTFSATVTAAPADGAVISGITRLELRGSGIANAELLPASGYAPKLGTFNVAADRSVAWLDFDTRSLPDGIRDVRISAYNVMEGQPGAIEIVAMPPRRWEVRNGNTAPFTATVTMAPPHGAIVSDMIRLEVRGKGIKNVELLPANGYSPKLAEFRIVNFAQDEVYAYAFLNTRNLPNGIHEARISAFNAPAGQPATEIIAMPVRQWEVRQ